MLFQRLLAGVTLRNTTSWRSVSLAALQIEEVRKLPEFLGRAHGIRRVSPACFATNAMKNSYTIQSYYQKMSLDFPILPMPGGCLRRRNRRTDQRSLDASPFCTRSSPRASPPLGNSPFTSPSAHAGPRCRGSTSLYWMTSSARPSTDGGRTDKIRAILIPSRGRVADGGVAGAVARAWQHVDPEGPAHQRGPAAIARAAWCSALRPRI
jgi:hypothetical protein